MQALDLGSKVEVICSNSSGITLKLLNGNGFQYIVGNLHYSILIEGSYRRDQLENIIICKVESRDIYGPENNAGYNRLLSSDTLTFHINSAHEIYLLLESKHISFVPILYKVYEDLNGDSIVWSYGHNNSLTEVYSQTSMNDESVLKCFSASNGSVPKELLWEISINNLSESNSQNGRKYSEYCLQAEMQIVNENWSEALSKYRRAFQHNSAPMSCDLFNALILSIRTQDNSLTRDLIARLLLLGNSEKSLVRKSPDVKKFLKAESDNYRLRNDRISQYSATLKDAFSRQLYIYLEKQDQYYRKPLRLKQYVGVLHKLDSTHQQRLIRYHELYGIPTEQDLQDYSKTKRQIFNSLPGMIVHIHNTYYGDYQLKEWLIAALDSGLVRSDIFAYLIGLEKQRTGERLLFGVPLIHKIKNDYYAGNYTELELEDINKNRSIYGLLDYDTELNYLQKSLKSKKITRSGYILRTFAIPVYWKGANKEDIIRIYNLRLLN